MEIHIYGKSVVGNSRRNNEDQIFCHGHYRKNLDELQDSYQGMMTGEDLSLFAIFDGMGGLSNGEKASGLCADILAGWLKESISGTREFNTIDCIKEMNRCIVREGRITKMGSTAVIAVCRNNTIQVANIGDSRAYWLHGHNFTQLSVDHTLEDRIKRLREEYDIDIDENDVQKHALTQYIGVPEDEFLIEPYVSGCITVEDGDQCLMCSDGLSNLVSDDQIEDILQMNIDNREKVSQLLNIALQNDRTDNISVILLGWTESKQESIGGV